MRLEPGRDVRNAIPMPLANLNQKPRELGFPWKAPWDLDWMTSVASYPGLTSAPLVAITVGESAQVVITRLQSENHLRTHTGCIPAQEAFILVLHLSDVVSQRWSLGDTVKSGRYSRGGVTIADLGTGPIAFESSAFDSLHFYIPYSAVEEFAREDSGCTIRSLACPNGAIDHIVLQLGLSILDAIQVAAAVSSRFIRHTLRALMSHFVRAYGIDRPEAACSRGGLAPWQTRRATEILLANVETGASLHAVARHCELSTSHFVRAFRQTVGQPPHRWLIEQRVELAKKLLLSSGKAVADIGLSVGYSDQASFTRAFKRSVGLAPAGWRRSNRA
jgi:AraC family transcriptional regulator